MAMCINPYISPTGAAFPCGRCTFCRKNRVRAWMFRLLQEDKVSLCSHFVTFTYDTSHVPISPLGFRTLCKTDIQDYMRNLRRRKANEGRKLKYYFVGEYGPKTERPHYHAIIFNSDADSLVSCWEKGNVLVGDVSGASVSYCAGYISKPGKKIPKGDWDDRKPQFSLMSKGLGISYLTPAVERFHTSDVSRNYVVQDGFKIAMPRYYRKKLPYTEEQLEELASIAEEKFMKVELANYDRVTEEYPLKSFSDWKREQIDFFRVNEKFLNRKL